MSLTWLIMTVLGTTVLFWNRAFISLWVGAEHYVGAIPDLLIVVVVLQFILIRNDGNVIDLSLRLKQKVIIGAISVGLSLSIAVALVSWLKLGIVGICIGLIAGRIILSAGYPILVGRLLGISFSFQLKSALRPAFVTFLFFSLATCFDNFISTTKNFAVGGWIGLGIFICVTAIGALALAFYLGLSSGQREAIIQRVRIVLAITKG